MTDEASEVEETDPVEEKFDRVTSSTFFRVCVGLTGLCMIGALVSGISAFINSPSPSFMAAYVAALIAMVMGPAQVLAR